MLPEFLTELDDFLNTMVTYVVCLTRIVDTGVMTSVMTSRNLGEVQVWFISRMYRKPHMLSRMVTRPVTD